MALDVYIALDLDDEEQDDLRMKNFRKGSKTMTAKLNYEDPTGRVCRTSLAPERVKTRQGTGY